MLKKAEKPAPETLVLKVGDVAPDFEAITTTGEKIRLAELRGKNLVLYFYPKDDTPGCTKEACGFRDNYEAIKKKAVLLGVSPDSPKKHQKFTEKFQLPFPLLADEDKKISQAYGVWGQKSFMGRKYMGVHRVTFLIDKNGRIARTWPNVKPDEHAAEVIAELS
jgi:thioredoxin-dependent peroxiredoxin